jgi:class 3 adenylate cyclase
MVTEASTPRRKLSAILMVDVSGFSRMMGRDEEGTTALIRAFHTRTRALVEAHEGWVVDTAGDSVFGEFDSVVNAVCCAQAIQQTQATDNAARPPEERIETRIGVHLGDVIVQDYHVYGDGVNIAARLQAVADPGSICVSEAVYQQVYKKLDLAFEDLGVQALKNIEHPLRLYRVVEPGHDRPAPSTQVPQCDRQTPRSGRPRPPTDSWVQVLLRPASLIPLGVAAWLLTTGTSVAAGLILAGVAIGRVWWRCTGRRSRFLIALGIAIMLGTSLTSWDLAKQITISGSHVTSTVGQSAIYDLIISGSNNLITTVQGSRINTIKISGSNNTLTVGRENSVKKIVTSGSNNKILVPSGSAITITANTGSNNQVQSYYPD